MPGRAIRHACCSQESSDDETSPPSLDRPDDRDARRDDRGRVRRPARTSPADPRLQGAYRSERDGWVYVHLEGSPERIGFQHGSLLAAEIGDFLRVIKPFLKKSSRRDWAFYREAAETMLWPRIDEEYRREIDGIVAGLASKGIAADRWDLVALNANQELPYYYVPWVDRREGKTPTTHAPGNCSAFIATGSYTRDGRIVMGHNAWTNYVVGTRWNIIFDLKPDAGSRILMDGLPGVIASDDDFGDHFGRDDDHRDDHHPVRGLGPEGQARVRPRPQGHAVQPLDRRVRRGSCSTATTAATPTTGSSATTRPARSPCSSWASRTTRSAAARTACFFGANFPDSDKLMREETKFDPDKKTSSPNARKVRWEQLIAEHKGKIDLELGKRFETDDFDVILRKREGERADALRARRDLAARRARVGLGPVLPRRDRAVEGDRRLARRSDGVLGPGWSSWFRLPRRALPHAVTRSTTGCGD